MLKFRFFHEPHTIPPLTHLHIGPLWISRRGKTLTVWWSHWLKVFHGEFMQYRKRTPSIPPEAPSSVKL